jgi:hypothetical protein
MKTFFESLFAYSSGHIEVRLLPSKKQEFFPIGSLDQLLEFIDQNIDQNVYFGVSTRNGGGKKEHIVHIPACWVDVDFKTTPREEIDKKLAGFPLKPSVIIGSGGGYHVYWKFKEPYTLAESAQIETLNHDLAHFFGGDHNACDVSRILRVPGTFNYKYEPKREVRVINLDGAEYITDDFEFLPPYEKPVALTNQNSTPITAQNNGKAISTIMSCKFMQHCRDDASRLSEPEWYAMITQLARLQGGQDYIHELSRPYPGYSATETNEKILHAINDSGPITCQRINQLWDCDQSCPVRAPAALQFKQQIVIENQTVFPHFAMGGLAGDFADLYSSYLEPPKEFFYFSFLTCLGSILANRVTLASEIRPQPRLYTLILGHSADGRKSTAISKTVEFFKGVPGTFHVCYGVGSAEGLQEKIKECGNNGLLLVYDELKALVSKCKIEGSVLLPCVNTLFESNRYESRTKHTDIFLENAHLSLLGASTIQTYENMWTTQFTDIGFNNRILIVPAFGTRKNPIPKLIPQQDKEKIINDLNSVVQLVETFPQLQTTPGADDLYRDWYLRQEGSIHTKRLDAYALRLMPLLTVNERKKMVDEEIVLKVIALMHWQLAMRKLYDPIDADNEVAKMEERIRRNLRTKAMSIRDLKRNCHTERHGIWLFQTALNNLTSASEVIQDVKDQTWRIR